jgi:hypothetical protein
MSNQALQRVPKATGYAFADGEPAPLAEQERAGLSVRSFADPIGMYLNSITNYTRRGDVPQHIALVTVLVAEMSANGIDYRAAIAKVAPTCQPRGATRRCYFSRDRTVGQTWICGYD